MGAVGRNIAPRQLANRREQISLILAGLTEASTAARLTGYPPAEGRESTDRWQFLEAFLEGGVRPEVAAAVKLAMQVRADAPRLWHAIELLDRDDEHEIRDRLYIYLAVEFADRSAQETLAAIVRAELVRSRSMGTLNRVYAAAFAAWLDTKPRATDGKTLGDKLDAMVRRLADDAEDVIAVKAALEGKIVAAPPPAARHVEPAEKLSPLNALARLAHDLEESERNRRPNTEKSATSSRTLVVVPPLGEPSGSNAQKDMHRQFKPVAGLPLPLTGTDDLAGVRQDLLSRYPHFATEIDLILRQRQPYRLLLVGSPGCGKTSLARDLADAIGLASVVYPAGGASDSAFAGTSAQWSTARASVPLQLVLRSRQANPLVVLDELEKSGQSRQNGSLVDSLLSFLEPGSARRILDPAIEAEVDLSAVSYVATANDLAGVPRPLLDRLRVIRMPDPQPEHLNHLLATMFDDIADERGIDRRWLQDLDGDELEIVRNAWPGGSLRRLRRVLELLLDGRERHLGRA